MTRDQGQVAVDDNPTPSDQAMIDADEQAQLTEDDLKAAEAIEVNNRRWLSASHPIINMAGYTDPLINQDVREALDWAIIAACDRAVRILKSDLPASR